MEKMLYLADDTRVEEGGDGCEGFQAGGSAPKLRLREVLSTAVRRELQSPFRTGHKKYRIDR